MPLEIVEKALLHSLYAVLARYNRETIGFARVVGDGGLCFYIQEIIVHPDHQRKGIASTFMQYILASLEERAIPRSYIGVFAGKGLKDFYRGYGFWERPSGVMGSGMMQFWKDSAFNQHFRDGND
ncbi:MAG: GNAT family N-acetyltransferase [Anaerolineales bacterium]|nr:GNAT family N-acetyltransferase [Anaerolineales bacterium]